jgi:serine/threonine protein kinase
VGDPIGRGGFGTVYLGMDMTTARHVAVKEVTFARGEISMDQIKAEYELLSELRHPHIVEVLSFDIVADKACIYMEWMPGGSVHGMIQSFRFRLHERLIRRYIKQALLGLSFLHERGIVHRDIKPANMLVTLDGTLKLSDFGSCKTLTGKSSTITSLAGTPVYMAPEAIRGVCSFSSDIWSLGGSIVEMATGSPPWAELQLDDNIAFIFHIGLSTTGPPIPPHLSHEGQDFLRRCFIINSKDRPSCAELLLHPFVQNPSGNETEGGMEDLSAYMTQRLDASVSAISNMSTQLELFTATESSPGATVHLDTK